MSDSLVWNAVYMGIGFIIGIFVIGTIATSLGTGAFATANYNATAANISSGFAQASALFPVVFIILMIVIVVMAVSLMRGTGEQRTGGM